MFQDVVRWPALFGDHNKEVRVACSHNGPAPHVSTLFHALYRLEAATSRLEDLAATPGAFQQSAANMGSVVSSSASASREPIPPPPPAPPLPPSAPVVAPEETPRTVIVFDEVVIDGKLKPFIELTKGFASASVIEQAGVPLSLSERNYADQSTWMAAGGSS